MEIGNYVGTTVVQQINTGHQTKKSVTWSLLENVIHACTVPRKPNWKKQQQSLEKEAATVNSNQKSQFLLQSNTGKMILALYLSNY
jgi:hypothetical protein